MRAIRIIHDEHRSIAAVLHGMLYLVRQIRDDRAKPNFELFRAMTGRRSLDQIRAFGWEGEPAPELLVFPIFTPRPTPLVE